MTPHELADRLRLAALTLAVLRSLLPPSEIEAASGTEAEMDVMAALAALDRAEDWVSTAHFALVARVGESAKVITLDELAGRLEAVAMMLDPARSYLSLSEVEAAIDAGSLTHDGPFDPGSPVAAVGSLRDTAAVCRSSARHIRKWGHDADGD